MRSSTLPLSVGAAVVLLVAAAAPASADHLGGVASLAKPQGCYLGELASGTGEAVEGRLVSSRTDADGSPKSFRCQIRDFPRFVDEETNPYGVGFVLNPRGYRGSNIPCLVGDAIDGTYGSGDLKIAGNGSGHLDCTFPAPRP